MNLGPPEIILIVAVIVLLFGARKLPELARSLGRAKTEFGKGIKEGGKDHEPAAKEDATPATPEKTDT